ncbi:MAG TPA: saccharopine dehydrogenase, partial [Gammaproteobacteria bacterium]|nr:saccharopine dehydrogenase [Gammaproteobacteria bacterium]
TGDRDPGYGGTAKMIAEAAVCLALDPLDESGGVMTPAVAMGEALIARLTKNAGLTFEVMD